MPIIFGYFKYILYLQLVNERQRVLLVLRQRGKTSSTAQIDSIGNAVANGYISPWLALSSRNFPSKDEADDNTS